jgi:hypothetical protein
MIAVASDAKVATGVSMLTTTGMRARHIAVNMSSEDNGI